MIEILCTMVCYYSLIPEKYVDSFIRLVETCYSKFYQSAGQFLSIRPESTEEQLPLREVSKQVTGSFQTGPSSTMEVTQQNVPMIVTGSAVASEKSEANPRRRSRSFSIDLLNHSTPVLRLNHNNMITVLL